MLLTYGVEPNTILNSPLTFRMNLSKIENLLMHLKSRSIEPIQSWMLTCSEEQLNTYVHIILIIFTCIHWALKWFVFVFCRMIKRQEKQKELLDGCSNAIDYIGKRLNWDEKTKENALKSCPALAKCNMSKVLHTHQTKA